MKRIRRLVIAAVIIIAAILLPLKNVFALEIGAGPAVWFAWWEPVFENQVRGHQNDTSFNSTYRMDPAFLVGGVLTARFLDRWSMSATFLWGSWYHAIGEYYGDAGAKFWTQDYKIKKFDFDFNAAYSFTQYFKVFIGLRVQGYDIQRHVQRTDVSTSNIDRDNHYNPRQLGEGPGAGIGITVPIGNDFFIICNASAVYMRAWVLRSPTDADPRTGIYVYYNLYGANTTLSLAYMISGANVTLNLGFRYQYLYYQYDGRATADSITASARNGNNDQFYGFTFMAVYSVTLM